MRIWSWPTVKCGGDFSELSDNQTGDVDRQMTGSVGKRPRLGDVDQSLVQESPHLGQSLDQVGGEGQLVLGGTATQGECWPQFVSGPFELLLETFNI